MDGNERLDRDTFDSRSAEDRIKYLNRTYMEDDEDVADELTGLLTLKREMEENSYSGDSWEDGIEFIADDYFEAYAEQFADDIGAIDRNATWPNTYIDWTAAADALQQDYTSVEYDGRTYWYR